MQSFILFFSFLVQLIACTQAEKHNSDPVIKTHVHLLGSTPITIKTRTYGTPSSVTFIQLHHNEETAEKAVLQVLEEKGGTLVSIENGSRRTISFRVNGKSYLFDPNRMFTKRGIRESLGRLGSYTPAAAAEVAAFARAILALLPQETVTVAVHNNTDQHYSILSYRSDPQLKQSAKAVYHNPQQDVDDFFITTQQDISLALKESGYNVVLQNNAGVFDDGSLSVLMGRQKRRYVT